MVSSALIATVSALMMGCLALGSLRLSGTSRRSGGGPWDQRRAANYLDSRTKAWASGGAMEHGTFCVSCHTALPFALARPALRTGLGERQASSAERLLMESITQRVRTWDKVQPYLGDKSGGLGTESVLNALILAQEDARRGKMSETTQLALRIMWSKQIKSGDRAGSWPWISAGNEPWEAPDSDYWGATLALVAAGTAPEGYLETPQIRSDLDLLRSYLRRGEAGKSLFNRLSLLWAGSKASGLLTATQRASIINSTLAKQHPDGGWSTAELIPESWARRDRTVQETKSDGYATGFVAYTLEESGVRSNRPELHKALSWLARNQDRSNGTWTTVSPNITRDGATDVGKFMTDAATAYAALALSSDH